MDYLVTDFQYQGRPLCAAALYEEQKLTELRVQTSGMDSRVGIVCKARVDTVAKNIGGAFLLTDRKGTKAFLPAKRARKLSPSESLLVQITKDASGSKEAVATENISLAGRFLVLTRKPGPTAFSSKLTSEQKQILRAWLRPDPCPDFHLLVRTNAIRADKSAFLREAEELAGCMRDILLRYEKAENGEELYRPDPFFIEMARDLYRRPDRILCRVPLWRGLLRRQYLKQYGEEPHMPEALPGTLDWPELLGLGHDLDRLLQKKVWLKSGGFLVIEKTEAFISVDVNTGRMEKGRIPEETYRKVNLEAAEELACQLRLRNLSGMILVDFISMENPDHREELTGVMRKLVRGDHIHTEVIDLTPLGIMEIVRQKVRKPLAEEMGLC